MSSNDIQTTPTSQFQRTWIELHAQTVTVLTAACRLRVPLTHSDGTAAAGEPVDFADFLASVLAAVAANLGSVDRVTAGRSGSWEADLVRRLVAGTVGDDEAWLYGHRTEPVVVPLNALELHWELPGFPDVDAAVEAALQPYDAVTAVTDFHPQVPDLTDEQWDTFEPAREATETAVLDAYTHLYAEYAQAFTAAVHTAAAAIPGLTASGAEVTVTAVHDPRLPYPQIAAVTNPGELPEPGGPDDALVARLWAAAVAAVPIPEAPAVTVPTFPALPARQPDLPALSDPTSGETNP